MPINPNRSRLDQQQILQHVFDGNEDRLRVDASVTATIGDVVIDADESDIAIADRVSGYLLKINSDGSIDANVTLDASNDSVAVPGVATEAKQDVGNLTLSGIQTTLNALNAKFNALGQQTSVGSLSVVLASDATLPLPVGAATEAKQDVGNISLNSIDGKLNTLGQKLAAGSVPVVLASDTTLPLPSGAATEAKQDVVITNLDTLNDSLSNLRQLILNAPDRQQDITYADFGTKNERITRIDYSSATYAPYIARQDIVYTLDGGKYRRDEINWSII